MKLKYRQMICFVMAVVTVISMLGGCTGKTQTENAIMLEEKLSSLWDTVSTDSTLQVPEDTTTVFFSVCNREEKAQVVHATGSNLDKAWEAAAKKAASLTKREGIIPYWVKADIVVDKHRFSLEEMQNEMGLAKGHFYRAGLSLDEAMTTAFLEAECNANGIYDYEGKTISEAAIKAYTGNKVHLPETVTAFVTNGYFCGTDNVVHKLSPYEKDYGIRHLVMDKESATSVVDLSMSYLQKQIQYNGKFRYGYRAASGEEIEGYNSLRHWGTVWSMVEAYKLNPSDSLSQTIRNAIRYGIEAFIVYREDGTAFVQDFNNGRIIIGGGGLAVTALCSYKEAFSDDQFDDLLHKLGNGILAMSDMETGKYCHQWTPDFKVAEEFVTVYYDGEATLGLCKLYAHDPNSDYLNMARKAVDRFIAEDYTKHRDHWVAYSVNELTKYDQSERYYAFALQNIQNNTAKILRTDESHFTNTELLMAGYDTYTRIIESGAEVKYLEQFDVDTFMEAIDYRLNQGLAAFGFPETVMYFENPMEMYGCFFSRRDNFRARIDDIQHMSCGYINYVKSNLS